MKKIVFLVNQSTGHYNSTFKLAKQLSQLGHEVIYLGEGRFRQLVAYQGFRFYEARVKPFRELKLKEEIRKRSSHFLGFLWFNFRSNFNGSRRKEVTEKIAEIDKLMDQLKPDLLIMDIFLSPNICFAYRYNIPIIIANTNLSLDRKENYPVVNSTLIPDGTPKSREKIAKQWRQVLLKQSLIRLFKRVIYCGQDYDAIQKRLAKKYRVPFRQLVDRNRMNHFGLRGIPEIILCAQPLDFPRATSQNQYYLGSKVDFSRKDVVGDPRYEEVMELLKSQPEKRVVYCSLGTLSTKHNPNSIAFFGKVIEAFRDMPGYNLVLTTGESLLTDNFGDLPPNVFTFYNVPQLEVLQLADVMISHGGSNSVEEAVLSGVPLLCYPTSKKWDQKGYATRILYHGLGMAGDLCEANADSISSEVKTLVENPKYRENVLKMREAIKEADGAINVEEIVLGQVIKEQPTTSPSLSGQVV